MASQNTTASDFTPLTEDMKSELKNFQNRLSQCSSQQRWLVIYHLLHNLMDDDPQEEIAVLGPDGESYVYITPPKVWFDRLMSNDDGHDFIENQASELSKVLEIIALSAGDLQVFADNLSKL